MNKQCVLNLWLGLSLLMGYSAGSLASQICRDPDQQNQPVMLPARGPALAESERPRYLMLDESRVLDRLTGLEWQRCSQGLSGAQCQLGRLQRFSFPAAMDWLAQIGREGWGGYHDWRLPTQAELLGLTKADCLHPAIDVTAFPNTPEAWFWTSTGQYSGRIYVDFKDGFSDLDDMNLANPIRLVRATHPPM